MDTEEPTEEPEEPEELRPLWRLITIARVRAARMCGVNDKGVQRAGKWFVEVLDDLPPLSEEFVERTLISVYTSDTRASAFRLFHRLAHYREGWQAAIANLGKELFSVAPKEEA